MATDEDYMAFLDKANKDPSEGYTKPQGGGGDADGFKTTDEGLAVPAVLTKEAGQAFYVSDADEPFVAVALRLGKGENELPDEVEFAIMIRHPDPPKADVKILDPIDWDASGQYNSVIDAVRKAGKGNDVRVYRIAGKGTRFEYWVVTTTDTGEMVGLKALAVES